MSWIRGEGGVGNTVDVVFYNVLVRSSGNWKCAHTKNCRLTECRIVNTLLSKP